MTNHHSILQELLTLVDSLDEDGPDFREKRAIKRIAHTLEKLAETERAA